MQVAQKTMQEVLKNLPLKQRQKIEGIINGKIIAEVYCNSGIKGRCKNRLLGYIHSDNSFHAVKEETGEMFCRAYVNRLDGVMGFECWCGNDSRLAKQYRDNQGMATGVYSKEDVEDALRAVAEHPSNYREVNGVKSVDGFDIRRVTP